MSANLFKQIYNKANDDIKKKLNTKNEKQLIRILAGIWDKFGKNVNVVWNDPSNIKKKAETDSDSGLPF